MFGMGTWEIIAILVVMLLLFGSRLPSVMRSLGKSVTEFKRGMNEIVDEQQNHPQQPQQYQQQQQYEQPRTPVQQQQQQPPKNQ